MHELNVSYRDLRILDPMVCWALAMFAILYPPVKRMLHGCLAAHWS